MKIAPATADTFISGKRLMDVAVTVDSSGRQPEDGSAHGVMGNLKRVRIYGT